ncbi:MAG: hypothetical protein M3464_06025, partial [Chloroflexota bacterium]|nr:hypothetical protein [Chloroflexota bacterium]
VAVFMGLNAVYLLGFARHRLLAYNVYIALSIAAVAARFYAQLETGDDGHAWLLPVLWVNLGLGSIVGLAGMIRLAHRDPRVWATRETVEARAEERRP